jgi:hypothetical protein
VGHLGLGSTWDARGVDFFVFRVGPPLREDVVVASFRPVTLLVNDVAIFFSLNTMTRRAPAGSQKTTLLRLWKELKDGTLHAQPAGKS